MFFPILEALFHFMEKIFFIIVDFFSNPLVQKIIIIYLICSVIIILISYIIVCIIKKKKKEKKQAELIRKQQEEFRRKEEEKRIAAIKAEEERKRAIEKERLRLKKEYQYGYRDDMTGYEYERYCTDLFKYFNWNAKTTKFSGDSGGDIIATKNGIKIVAQCKKWQDKVNFRAIEEVWTAKGIYQTNYAIVITNSEYTKQAIRDAKKLGVVLLRHPELEGWLKQLIPEKQENNIKQISNNKSSIRKEENHPKKEIVLNLHNSMTLEEFTNKYKEKLEPYVQILKITEGDDFNLYKESYDSWKELNNHDINADEWINTLVDSITDSFKDLEEKYGPVKDFTDEIINKIIEDEKNNAL